MKRLKKLLSTWQGKAGAVVAGVIVLIVFSDFLVSLFGA